MVTVTTRSVNGNNECLIIKKGKYWLPNDNNDGSLVIFGKKRIIAEFAPGTWLRVEKG